MKKPVPKPPTCPFCGRFIKKPEFLPIGLSDLEAGVCECGSVYVCDVTGHNRGNAFIEALFLATAGDWDLMWELTSEEDYQEVWIEDYDLKTHTILPMPVNPRVVSKGALCFIKLAEDIRELKRQKLKEVLQKENVLKKVSPKFQKKLSKQEVETLLQKEDFNTLASYIISEPLNLNILQKFFYHPDIVFRRKAVVALGKAASPLAKVRPEKLLDFIKKLLYAAADSAASAWGALEAVGEVIRETGDRYAIFIKNLFAFLKFPEYHPYVIYALYRISEKNPEVLKKHSYFLLLDLIEGSTSEIKAVILKIFANLKAKEISPYLNRINPDEEAEIFDHTKFVYQRIKLKEIIEQIERG
ncbi:hypothetical protein F1847_01175 [Thermodesulfobacterium sp. TA1]|uniref:DVU0298 family protein n=1 Tax=Thermodesulfobacterium sp. TA1 TaxID=2234087 RepID=UPI0012318EDD|nr:DVU0298 family protein [Thermodesulfobacterium sp. TA1]QER41417.1 hypothetical protein F1847_01175 [Thermodesulfobacterium sp. TA1]